MTSPQVFSLLRALKRADPVFSLGPRHIPAPFARFPCEEGRLIIPGPHRPVAGIGRAELAAAVTAATTNRRDTFLIHRGMLLPAGDVVWREPEFFGEAVETLVDHVLRNAKTPEEQLAALQRLLGGDMVGGWALSLEERSTRVAKALMSIVAEFSAYDNLPVDMMLDPRMLDWTVDFVRNYVTRGGWVHASRAELRQIALMELEFAGWLTTRYQLPLPALLGGTLLPGPDSVLYHALFAHYVQLKAYRSLGSLAIGTPVIRTTEAFEDGKKITVVTGIDGPAIHHQAFTDGVRSRHRSHKAPGPTVTNAPEDGTLPSNLTGWHDVSPKSVYWVEDGYLVDTALEPILGAAYARRSDTVDIMTDVDASLTARERMIDVFGGRTVDVRGPDEVRTLQERGQAWVRTWLPHLEGDVNTWLGTTEVVDRIGRRNEVVLVPTSDGPAAIPAALGIPPRP